MKWREAWWRTRHNRWPWKRLWRALRLWPQVLVHPGVYIAEHVVDRPVPIDHVYDIIGACARGPVDVPTRIYSMAQFVEVFGDEGDVARSVWAFLRDGGRNLVVTRVRDEEEGA
jgi:hypothetical protein